MTAMKRYFIFDICMVRGFLYKSRSEFGGELSATEYYIPGYMEADTLKEPDVCTDGLVSLQFSGELYLPYRGEKGDKFRELNAFTEIRIIISRPIPGVPTHCATSSSG